MTAKRALIVDDSRSARVILSRMLESYGLAVDAAEAAEQAFEFLEHTRPDVIFMDHLMPGMDGFQAVQALKSNPATATIPVLMYTSQEGELYVGQARALGAVGVLPKTVKHADVSRVLYQLNLLQDRREGRSAVFDSAMPAGGSSRDVEVASARAEQFEPSPATTPLESSLEPLLASAFKEQQIELRRFMLASFEAFVRRVSAEIRSTPAAHPESTDPASLLATSATSPSSSRWAWLMAGIAIIALLPTVILGAFYLRIMDTTRSLTDANIRLAQLVAEQQAQINSLRDAPATGVGLSEPGAMAANTVEAEAVGYGEVPLAGARVEKLRSLIGRLQANGFQGTVRIESFIGDFCLAGNALEGFSLAAEDLLARRCDVTGNPFEDSLTGAQRQSLPFANLVASLFQETAGNIRVEVIAAGRRPVIPYPTLTDGLTAGEWNRAASRNNRVEFMIEPAG